MTYIKELIECIKKHQDAIKYKYFTPAPKWTYIIIHYYLFILYYNTCTIIY